jgi:hypothetical protein
MPVAKVARGYVVSPTVRKGTSEEIKVLAVQLEGAGVKMNEPSHDEAARMLGRDPIIPESRKQIMAELHSEPLRGVVVSGGGGELSSWQQAGATAAAGRWWCSRPASLLLRGAAAAAFSAALAAAVC